MTQSLQPASMSWCFLVSLLAANGAPHWKLSNGLSRQPVSHHVQVGMLRHPGAVPAEASGLTSAACDTSAGACAYVWHALAQQHGLHAHPLPEQQHAGSFVVPATVYPSPRLTAGSAAASSSLAASLGRPSIGTDLVVYPWPAAAAQPSQVQHFDSSRIVWTTQGSLTFGRANSLQSMQRKCVQHVLSMMMPAKIGSMHCASGDWMGSGACCACRTRT